MTMFSSRNNGILLFTLVIVLGWYLLAIKQPADTQVAEENMEFSAVDHSGADEHEAVTVASNLNETTVVQPAAKAEQTVEDIQVPIESEELIEWRLERGYPDEANSYDNYDEATLNTLADSGDVRAMHTLAEQYARRGNLSDEDKKAVADIYRAAALHGSTFAFLHLGIQQEATFGNLSADDPKRHETAIEILATYNVAALRGDKMPNIARGNHFVAQNNIQLTEEDKQQIQSRSQDIYNNLARHRYALSLEEFDNSVPESVSQYFSEVEAVQEKVKQRAQ